MEIEIQKSNAIIANSALGIPFTFCKIIVGDYNLEYKP